MFRIVEHNCAIWAVAQRYGQACTSEIDFIRTVLPDADVERVQHMVAGAPHCAYEVRAARVGRVTSGRIGHSVVEWPRRSPHSLRPQSSRSVATAKPRFRPNTATRCVSSATPARRTSRSTNAGHPGVPSSAPTGRGNRSRNSATSRARIFGGCTALTETAAGISTTRLEPTNATRRAPWRDRRRPHRHLLGLTLSTSGAAVPPPAAGVLAAHGSGVRSHR